MSPHTAWNIQPPLGKAPALRRPLSASAASSRHATRTALPTPLPSFSAEHMTSAAASGSPLPKQLNMEQMAKVGRGHTRSPQEEVKLPSAETAETTTTDFVIKEHTHAPARCLEQDAQQQDRPDLKINMKQAARRVFNQKKHHSQTARDLCEAKSRMQLISRNFRYTSQFGDTISFVPTALSPEIMKAAVMECVHLFGWKMVPAMLVSCSESDDAGARGSSAGHRKSRGSRGSSAGNQLLKTELELDSAAKELHAQILHIEVREWEHGELVRRRIRDEKERSHRFRIDMSKETMLKNSVAMHKRLETLIANRRWFSEALKTFEKLATSKWLKRISEIEACISFMADDFKRRQVDLPDPHRPSPPQQWKLNETELENCQKGWLDVVEVILTPFPDDHCDVRKQLINSLIHSHFDNNLVLVGGRRRIAKLREQVRFLTDKQKMWREAFEYCQMHDAIWAATKIQALVRSRQAQKRCARMRMDREAHARRLHRRTASHDLLSRGSRDLLSNGNKGSEKELVTRKAIATDEGGTEFLFLLDEKGFPTIQRAKPLLADGLHADGHRKDGVSVSPLTSPLNLQSAWGSLKRLYPPSSSCILRTSSEDDSTEGGEQMAAQQMAERRGLNRGRPSVDNRCHDTDYCSPQVINAQMPKPLDRNMPMPTGLRKLGLRRRYVVDYSEAFGTYLNVDTRDSKNREDRRKVEEGRSEVPSQDSKDDTESLETTKWAGIQPSVCELVEMPICIQVPSVRVPTCAAYPLAAPPFASTLRALAQSHKGESKNGGTEIWRSGDRRTTERTGARTENRDSNRDIWTAEAHLGELEQNEEQSNICGNTDSIDKYMLLPAVKAVQGGLTEAEQVESLKRQKLSAYGNRNRFRADSSPFAFDPASISSKHYKEPPQLKGLLCKEPVTLVSCANSLAAHLPARKAMTPLLPLSAAKSRRESERAILNIRTRASCAPRPSISTPSMGGVSYVGGHTPGNKRGEGWVSKTSTVTP